MRSRSFPSALHHRGIADGGLRLLAWLLLFWLAACGQAFGGDAGRDAATPDDYIVQRGYWRDDSGQAAFDDARRQVYTPYSLILNRGFTEAAHWVRLRIAASTEPLALRIGPAWLDSILLYDPAYAAEPVTAGDRHPLREGALPGLGYTFVLPPGAQPRDIWLRLESTSAHWLVANAAPVPAQSRVGTRQIIWASAYTSVLLLILFLLASLWWGQREKILGLYLIRHAAYTYYGAAYLGLPAMLLPDWLAPAWHDLGFSLTVVAMLPLSVCFDQAFIGSYRPHRFWLWMLRLSGLSGLGLIALLLSGHVSLALYLNACAVMIGIVFMTLAALSCPSSTDVQHIMPRNVMVAYYLLIFSSLVVGVGSLLGWLKTSSWSQYTLILHGLVSGLFMAGILFVRAQRLAERSRQIAWQLHQAQQETALEQRRREEQSQFLHMLMHELKTPLSVVSFALGNKTNREQNLDHAGRAIQDMKAVIERCVQADQVSKAELTLHKRAFDLPALIGACLHDLPEAGTRVTLACADALPIVESDPQLLRIAIGNLVANALRYSDPLTPVELRLVPESRQQQPGIRLDVANRPGMAGWPDPARVFSKYYRADGAQRQSGSGLGLYLSRQLAQSLGSTLDYAPTDTLVQFSLWIPQTLN